MSAPMMAALLSLCNELTSCCDNVTKDSEGHTLLLRQNHNENAETVPIDPTLN